LLQTGAGGGVGEAGTGVAAGASVGATVATGAWVGAWVAVGASVATGAAVAGVPQADNSMEAATMRVSRTNTKRLFISSPLKRYIVYGVRITPDVKIIAQNTFVSKYACLKKRIFRSLSVFLELRSKQLKVHIVFR
jgi:hypothetical protein